MESWDVRLLTASYRRNADDTITIEMYGKTKEGESIAIRYSGFLPYFHVLSSKESVVEILKDDQNIVYIQEIELFHKSATHKAAKIVLKFPWIVPEYRSRMKRHGLEVFAADIPFHHRFIYDFDIPSCLRIYGKRCATEGYTTDIVVDMEKINNRPHFEEIPPFNPELKILAFDVENSVKDNHIYTICYAIKDCGKIRNGKPLIGGEKEIIEAFSRVIQEEDPDVITGYNIDGYDIPILIERGKVLGITELRWGRDLSNPRQIMNHFWRLTGRLIADAWWAAKIQLRPKQETLNHVAKLLLGEEKIDVDPTKIDEEWVIDREKVLRYCLKDAELSLRVLESVDILRKNMDLAAVSRLPIDDVLNSGASQLIDSILIRAADREIPPIAVPLTGSSEEEDTIEGGYVHTIEPGIYHWVCILDFKSMYPSLIISKNICFTTLNEKGEIVSPTGVRFLSKKQKEGLLPRILTKLMKDRDEIKKKMKEAGSPDEYRYYDGLQGAIKVLMNAFYGVFASSFYRFTDRKIGGSITAFARETIKGIIAELENEGYKVIYSDTDSIFIQSPYENLEDTKRFGYEIATRFSGEGRSLEFEKIVEPLFTHGKKKRYVGRVIWPSQEILIRGYEVRRTDSFDLQSEVLMQVFEKILDGKTEDAVRVARQAVADTLAGRVAVEKLVISRSCKAFNQYKDPDSQATVQTARKLMAMGYEFVPGMKVSWIVTDSRRTPQTVEPFISGKRFNATPDWRYYAERLAQTVARATEVFGWDEQSLMLGSQQFTLFDHSFGEEKSRKNAMQSARKTQKKLSLEDFM
ncbi:MAG: DNA polymerase domain-containing protein [Methanomassiliicoccales archaeon]